MKKKKRRKEEALHAWLLCAMQALMFLRTIAFRKRHIFAKYFRFSLFVGRQIDPKQKHIDWLTKCGEQRVEIHSVVNVIRAFVRTTTKKTHRKTHKNTSARSWFTDFGIVLSLKINKSFVLMFLDVFGEIGNSRLRHIVFFVVAFTTHIWSFTGRSHRRRCRMGESGSTTSRRRRCCCRGKTCSHRTRSFRLICSLRPLELCVLETKWACVCARPSYIVQVYRAFVTTGTSQITYIKRESVPRPTSSLTQFRRSTLFIHFHFAVALGLWTFLRAKENRYVVFCSREKTSSVAC